MLVTYHVDLSEKPSDKADLTPEFRIGGKIVARITPASFHQGSLVELGAPILLVQLNASHLLD
jgi:hypothetical protein